MSMIDASEPLFKDLFPNGCIVHDRTGRELTNVVACNPETGEVITYTQMPFIVWWARAFWRFRFWQPRGLIAWSHESCMLRRHGFWPAPLTITPNQCPQWQLGRLPRRARTRVTTHSPNKRVSERIIWLLNEVKLHNLVPVEIILGNRAGELLKNEMAPLLIHGCKVDGTSHLPKKKLPTVSFFHGIQVTVSNVEEVEYVGIDCEI